MKKWSTDICRRIDINDNDQEDEGMNSQKTQRHRKETWIHRRLRDTEDDKNDTEVVYNGIKLWGTEFKSSIVIFSEPRPLGMEDGTIMDSQIFASSSTSPGKTPWNARLNGPGAWCSADTPSYGYRLVEWVNGRDRGEVFLSSVASAKFLRTFANERKSLKPHWVLRVNGQSHSDILIC